MLINFRNLTTPSILTIASFLEWKANCHSLKKSKRNHCVQPCRPFEAHISNSHVLKLNSSNQPSAQPPTLVSIWMHINPPLISPFLPSPLLRLLIGPNDPIFAKTKKEESSSSSALLSLSLRSSFRLVIFNFIPLLAGWRWLRRYCASAEKDK